MSGHGDRPRLNSEEDKETEYDKGSLNEWHSGPVEVDSVFQKSLSSSRANHGNKIGRITLNQNSQRCFHNVYDERDKEDVLQTGQKVIDGLKRYQNPKLLLLSTSKTEFKGLRFESMG